MKYKVLLNSHYFTATAGGTDLFIKILNNLLVNNKYEYFVLIPKNNFINTNSNLSEVKNAQIKTIFKKLNKAVLLSKNTRIKIGTKQNGMAEIQFWLYFETILEATTKSIIIKKINVTWVFKLNIVFLKKAKNNIIIPNIREQAISFPIMVENEKPPNDTISISLI